MQCFHSVVTPLGETRPAWKVLRVLANLLELPGFDYESSQDVLTAAIGAETKEVPSALRSNITKVAAKVPENEAAEPVTASIYQLDGIVRRATSLQLTADARLAREGGAA